MSIDIAKEKCTRVANLFRNRLNVYASFFYHKQSASHTVGFPPTVEKNGFPTSYIVCGATRLWPFASSQSVFNGFLGHYSQCYGILFVRQAFRGIKARDQLVLCNHHFVTVLKLTATTTQVALLSAPCFDV